MSGMAVGSMIEADRRMLAYERKIRAEKRIARDAEVWKRYEMDFEESAAQRGGREGAAAKGKE